MEKEKFEKSVSSLFDGAEVAPSPGIWTNIELGLEKAAGGRMKRRLLYYQWMAAASIFVTITVGGYYYLQPTLSNQMMQGQTVKEPLNAASPTELPPNSLSITEKQDSPASTANEGSVAGTNSLSDKLLANSSSINPAFVKKSKSSVNQNEQLALSDNQNQQVGSQVQFSVRTIDGDQLGAMPLIPVTALTAIEKPALVLPQETEAYEMDPGALLLARLKDEEERYKKEEQKKPAERFWTSAGFAAGTFDPSASASNQQVFSGSPSSGGNSYDTSPSAGASYSFGVQVGGRISKRLVLQGGVSYLTQNASFQSNVASQDASTRKAYLNDFAFTGNNQAVTTTPYAVNSNLQYISLPVQAGYVVLDRTFSIQLNGGIATDLFIVNTLDPDSPDIQKVSQGPGDDSPYRPISFSGLVGTEFSYRFSRNYRISLNPGIRYSLNSIYKSEVPAQVSPMTVDVALRFKYIIR